MRVGESRHGDLKFVVVAHQLVRGWAWLYTLGLALETRSARRTEIDSDLWDQTHAWGVHEPSTSGDASSVLLRCLRGVPADLLWRFAEARTPSSSGEGWPTLETFTMRSWLGFATIMLMSALVVATFALTVVHTIEWDNPGTRIITPWLKILVGLLLLAAGLVLATSGFGLIRRAPWLGAVLAISGTWMVAMLFYWMLYPVLLFIAAGASVFAIGSARRHAAASAREKGENE